VQAYDDDKVECKYDYDCCPSWECYYDEDEYCYYEPYEYYKNDSKHNKSPSKPKGNGY
jgi:hypothetical protein